MPESKPKETVSEFSQPNRAAPTQTIKCFVVPVDAMELIRDAIREAPHKMANPVLQQMATLQVMDVPVGPPPDKGQ